jgi:hypothetical protein
MQPTTTPSFEREFTATTLFSCYIQEQTGLIPSDFQHPTEFN